MAGESGGTAKTWRSCQQDLSDAEWDLIADLVPTFSGGGRMGRPATHAKRDIVNAIFYVAATGCQWRALPRCYPHWNTVYRYHLAWSRDGTWEALVDRLRTLVRDRDGRDPEPSAGIVDARSTQGASTVCGPTRGYDAGKKISGRKTFGVVDTLGLLVSVVVVAANTSDNIGGIDAVGLASFKTSRLTKVWCDAGFKATFERFCGCLLIDPMVIAGLERHDRRSPPSATAGRGQRLHFGMRLTFAFVETLADHPSGCVQDDAADRRVGTGRRQTER